MRTLALHIWFPIMGASTRIQLQGALAALKVTLSAAEAGRLEEILEEGKIVGTRYGADNANCFLKRQCRAYAWQAFKLRCFVLRLGYSESGFNRP